MVRLLNTISKILIWLVLVIYNLDSIQYYFGFQIIGISSDIIIAGVILLIVVSILLLALALISDSPAQLASASYNKWYGLDLLLLPIALIFFVITGAITTMILFSGVLLLLQLGIVLRYPAVREEEKQLRGGLGEITGMFLVLIVFAFVSNISSFEPLVVRGIWMIIVGLMSYSVLKTNNALTTYQDQIISTVSDDTTTDDLLYKQAA